MKIKTIKVYILHLIVFVLLILFLLSAVIILVLVIIVFHIDSFKNKNIYQIKTILQQARNKKAIIVGDFNKSLDQCCENLGYNSQSYPFTRFADRNGKQIKSKLDYIVSDPRIKTYQKHPISLEYLQ
jgi:hypothetical protein